MDSRLGTATRGAEAEATPPEYILAREVFANRFLAGSGLEVGALHWPLEVPSHVRVSYVDRMTTKQLRDEYPELEKEELVEVDVIDDGAFLATVAPESQDFIIANHFLEHTADPIATVEAHLSKLKPGGILFYAVPDKRYTFDFRRPLTPIEHIVADYEEGPERSRAQHFDEVALLTPDQDYDPDDPASVCAFESGAKSHARHLEETDYSIHHHVWTQASFLELLLHLRERFNESFDIEAVSRRSLEFVAVLRKNGAWPVPILTPESPPDIVQAEIEELRRRNEQLTAALANLEHSASWRLTRPLRETRAAFGRRRRST